jgi:fucose 4-O-acetylase-like acetyltransferase
MKTRQAIPDWIKGLAIVLMVYGHTSHIGSLAALQRQIVDAIYTFHMPIFLILSGFFFRTNNEAYETGGKLVRRLLLPYLIFVSLYLFGLVLIKKTGIPTSNPAPDSPIDFLQTVFFRPIGAYWFIHSLIVIQLCFLAAKIMTLWNDLEEQMFLVVSISLVAIVCVFGLLAPRTALYFLLGMALARISGVLPSSLGIGLILIGILFAVGKEELHDTSAIQVAWVLSILAFLGGIGKIMEFTLIFSTFSWFGRNSLIVLVLHAMFIVLLKPFSGLLLTLDSTGLAYSSSVATIAILGSLFTAFLFDKARVSIYLFGVRTMYSHRS